MLTLSVITPTLNQGAFIERAIRSVLAQDYKKIEYVVVDGGSSDQTLEVIERYKDRLHWWVSEPDQGQTDAINKGLEHVTGDVIAYLNSDDYYLPGAFTKAMMALEQSGASWVAGAALDLDEHDRPTDMAEWIPHLPEFYERRPRGKQWWVKRPWSVPQPSSFWRRSLFERYGGFRTDMHFALDVEFMVRLALAGELPVLLQSDYLSARVLHADAKSFDVRKWEPEYALLRRLHRGELSPTERMLLRYLLIRDPVAAWLNKVRNKRLRRDFIYPAIERAGDLLDYVPERIRPKIRTRDRRE